MPEAPAKPKRSSRRLHSTKQTLARDVGDISGTASHRLDTVVIRTLPLWRGNYGGILQAYALQSVMARYANTVLTDVSERLSLPAATRRLALRWMSRLARKPLGYVERARSSNVNHAEFVATHMKTARLFAIDRFLNQRLLNDADAIVVGSDQVWRPEYGDLRSFLLDFVSPSSVTRRVAYAASFGTDKPNIDAEATREYAARFDSVSVRELSAVRLCADLWGVDAIQVPDPTLLLEPNDYAALLGGGMDGSDARHLTCYFLDKSPSKLEIAQALAAELVMDVHHADAGHGAARAPIESWLRGLSTAGLVVTDSFHGCVFAILFNRPFVAIGNEARGLARFEALLDTYGLRQRLILPSARSNAAELLARIGEVDWTDVNRRLADERKRGLAFIEHALRMT